jgi:SET and MYND domain-containing protein 4
MQSGKSNEQAQVFLSEGAELLAQQKFFDALVALNKNLCVAEPGSIEMSATFETRAEVFLSVGQFEKCQKNLQAAMEHGCSGERLQALKNSEEKCKRLMTTADSSSIDELCNFVSMKLPRNKKIPFIADCLELREDDKFGRFIVTNRDLSPGDVIAVEESHFHFLSPQSIFIRCFNCFRSNMLDLMPSSASVMFCSEECCKETHKKFNGKDELIRDSLRGNDIRQKMMRIMNESLNATRGFDDLQSIFESLKSETLFDFDFSDSNELARKL